LATDPTAGAAVPHALITHGITRDCIAGPCSQWQRKSVGAVQPIALAAEVMHAICLCYF